MALLACRHEITGGNVKRDAIYSYIYMYISSSYVFCIFVTEFCEIKP